MELLGSLELGTNNRITLPSKIVQAVGFKQGMVLLVYEDKGNLVIKRPTGRE